MYLKCPSCGRMGQLTMKCRQCGRTEWVLSSTPPWIKCEYCEQIHTDGVKCPSCGDHINPHKCQVYKGQSGGSSGNGCFVTEACCTVMGLDDNCYEMERFRNFRDNWLAKQPGGDDLISEYYEIAPKIVKSIHNRNDSTAILLNIWNEYLKPCLSLIENDKQLNCRSLYVT